MSGKPHNSSTDSEGRDLAGLPEDGANAVHHELDPSGSAGVGVAAKNLETEGEIADKLPPDGPDEITFTEADLSAAVYEDCVFELAADEVIAIDLDAGVSERAVAVFHDCRILPAATLPPAHAESIGSPP